MNKERAQLAIVAVVVLAAIAIIGYQLLNPTIVRVPPSVIILPGTTVEMRSVSTQCERILDQLGNEHFNVTFNAVVHNGETYTITVYLRLWTRSIAGTSLFNQTKAYTTIKESNMTVEESHRVGDTCMTASNGIDLVGWNRA